MLLRRQEKRSGEILPLHLPIETEKKEREEKKEKVSKDDALSSAERVTRTKL